MPKNKKIKKIILLVCLLTVIVVIAVYLLDFSKSRISWGVTFSPEYAQNELGLDWRSAYLAILDDLKVDHVRLSAYWNQVEAEKGSLDYDDLDWQIAEAGQRDVKIILAVGRRLPRWPECHDPSWLASTTPQETKDKQLAFVENTVKRYESNPNIIYFQIENEPFLKYFGKCPPLDKELLKQEIKLVKSLTSKPVLVTDSGELSSWLEAGNSGADLLGTTLYRTVYNPQFGYFHWFLPPVFYSAKTGLIKMFSPIEKVIVAELQTEAWHKENKNLRDMTMSENSESMSLKQFRDNIVFSRRAGFAEIYLWGVEWWYYLKEQKGEAGYWQEAKKLWQ